ncbi:MAG: hypothetical protein EOP06_16915 [Proteobacteria bacterium]|nr:MAG: hypothetical protein EOP06_16915 [Pseudomonadota bacterium]
MGYNFVLFPVLASAVIVVGIAVFFNFLFKWRRYPAFWNHETPVLESEEVLSHEAVIAALRSLDSFVDITEDDLLRLHRMLSAKEI